MFKMKNYFNHFLKSQLKYTLFIVNAIAIFSINIPVKNLTLPRMRAGLSDI